MAGCAQLAGRDLAVSAVQVGRAERLHLALPRKRERERSLDVAKYYVLRSYSTYLAPGSLRSTAVAAQLSATVAKNAIAALAIAGNSMSNSQYCSHSTIG